MDWWYISALGLPQMGGNSVFIVSNLVFIFIAVSTMYAISNGKQHLQYIMSWLGSGKLSKMLCQAYLSAYSHLSVWGVGLDFAKDIHRWITDPFLCNSSVTIKFCEVSDSEAKWLQPQCLSESQTKIPCQTGFSPLVPVPVWLPLECIQFFSGNLKLKTAVIYSLKWQIDFIKDNVTYSR